MIKTLKFNIKNNKLFRSKRLALFVWIVLNLSPLHTYGAQNCSSYLNSHAEDLPVSSLSFTAEDLPASGLSLTAEDLLPTNAYFYLSRTEDQVRTSLNLPSKLRVQFTDDEQILLSSRGLPHFAIERRNTAGEVIFRLPKGLRYRGKLQKKLLNFWNDDWLLTDIKVIPGYSPMTLIPNPKSIGNLNPSTEFLQQQALRQLQFSTTLKASPSGLKIFISAQTQALEYILQKLRSKTPLYIEDLNFINLSLIENPVLRRSDTSSFKLGHVRGTPNSDLSQMRIQENAVGLEFLNPILVPQAMDVLLFNINKINSNTSLKEIAKIYQDFIFIHPYLDGNGRTSRVLLDYMLLKGGFNFLNHNLNTSIIALQSVNELAANLSLSLTTGF